MGTSSLSAKEPAKNAADDVVATAAVTSTADEEYGTLSTMAHLQLLSKADLEFECTKFLIGQKYKIYRLIQLNCPEIDVATFQLVYNEIIHKTYRLQPKHMKYLELFIDITAQNMLMYNF